MYTFFWLHQGCEHSGLVLNLIKTTWKGHHNHHHFAEWPFKRQFGLQQTAVLQVILKVENIEFEFKAIFEKRLDYVGCFKWCKIEV